MQTYEIHCGDRVVTQVQSHTPRYAITDYLRSLGCTDDEIEAIGSDAVAWRGAVYTAIAVGEPASAESE
ncbi:MAG TPA: hypothetical protein VJ807_09075 [Gaiellaceae bacterium]|nr:hypothetical protein [Gaiellaceae bacterium]